MENNESKRKRKRNNRKYMYIKAEKREMLLHRYCLVAQVTLVVSPVLASQPIHSTLQQQQKATNDGDHGRRETITELYIHIDAIYKPK